VVGILVEESLLVRSVIDHKKYNDLNRKKLYAKGNNISISFFNKNDIDIR
tara:strand:- start:229 stop:378 length:150 start_codon:yes stop_codon:yes gene_type:complete